MHSPQQHVKEDISYEFTIKDKISHKKSTENCAGQIKQLLGSKFAAKKTNKNKTSNKKEKLNEDLQKKSNELTGQQVDNKQKQRKKSLRKL